MVCDCGTPWTFLLAFMLFVLLGKPTCGPGVSLTLCCFVVYSTRRFVLCLTLCHFVLVFFSPFSIVITSLGEERANLSAFRTFVRFLLVWICRFPLRLGVWEGLRFVILALPGLFSYLFLCTLCSRAAMSQNCMILDTSTKLSTFVKVAELKIFWYSPLGKFLLRMREEHFTSSTHNLHQDC